MALKLTKIVKPLTYMNDGIKTIVYKKPAASLKYLYSHKLAHTLPADHLLISQQGDLGIRHINIFMSKMFGKGSSKSSGNKGVQGPDPNTLNNSDSNLNIIRQHIVNGNALFKQSKYADAKAAYNKAMFFQELSSNNELNIEASFNLALAYMCLSEPQKAIGSLTSAIDLPGADKDAMNLALGKAHLANGEMALANEHFKKVAAMSHEAVHGEAS